MTAPAARRSGRTPAARALLAVLLLVLVPALAGGNRVRAAAAHWRQVITVPHAGALAIDRRGPARAAKWAYAANDARHVVVKFGTGGRQLTSWPYGQPAGYDQGAGMAVGGSGNVFVADPAANRVLKFDPSGHILATYTGFDGPRAVALDRQGNVYVAEQGALQVTRLSPGGQVLAHFHVPWVNGAGSGIPLALAIDPRGNIWVGADCYRDECPPPHGIQYAVIELNVAGVMQTNLLGSNPYTGSTREEEPFITVTAVALDARGRLYVGGTIRSTGDHLAPGILVYGPATTRQALYSLPGTRDPAGIAFDGQNALYAAQGGRVLKLAG